jgi:hypothetical protein
MMTEQDYSKFQKRNSNLDTVLMQLGEELEICLEEQENLTGRLEEINAKIKRYQEKLIPEAAEGVEGKLVLPNDMVFTIKEDIRINASKEKTPKIINWLTEIGSDNIVKRQLICEFQKGETEKFKKIREAIHETDASVPMKSKANVHYQTLLSFVKEKLKKGDEVPIDLLGVFRQRVAKLERK